jgi:hypothetical protein
MQKIVEKIAWHEKSVEKTETSKLLSARSLCVFRSLCSLFFWSVLVCGLLASGSPFHYFAFFTNWSCALVTLYFTLASIGSAYRWRSEYYRNRRRSRSSFGKVSDRLDTSLYDSMPHLNDASLLLDDDDDDDDDDDVGVNYDERVDDDLESDRVVDDDDRIDAQSGCGTRWRVPRLAVSDSAWTLFQICYASSWVVSLFFWLVLFPDIHARVMKPPLLAFYEVAAHTFNIVMLTADLLLSKMEMPLGQCVFSIAYGLAYALVAIIIYAATGHWEYPFLDMSHATAIVWYAALFAAFIAFHAVGHGIVRLRQRYLRVDRRRPISVAMQSWSALTSSDDDDSL